MTQNGQWLTAGDSYGKNTTNQKLGNWTFNI
jgi:hypothetical protein